MAVECVSLCKSGKAPEPLVPSLEEVVASYAVRVRGVVLRRCSKSKSEKNGLKSGTSRFLWSGFVSAGASTTRDGQIMTWKEALNSRV